MYSHVSYCIYVVEICELFEFVGLHNTNLRYFLQLEQEEEGAAVNDNQTDDKLPGSGSEDSDDEGSQVSFSLVFFHISAVPKWS